MEVTRAKVLLLASALTLVSFSNKFEARSKAPMRTERWMEAVLPLEVAGLRMIPSRSNPRQSYRADAKSYRELKPYGIVCRVFGTRQRSFDVNVIASNTVDSFHSPEGCLPLYGWNVVESRNVWCVTQTQGRVPVCVLRFQTPQGRRNVVICYKGCDGFKADYRSFARSWILDELTNGHSQEGVYYRVVQDKDHDSEQDLVSFLGLLLDRAGQQSDNVL